MGKKGQSNGAKAAAPAAADAPKVAAPKEQEKRSTPMVILLQLGIRLRYLAESWLFLKPFLLTGLTGYPSRMRPKGLPTVDWGTMFGLKMLWFVGAGIRAVRPLMYLFVALRIMHLLNWIHSLLIKRVCRIMEESGVDWEKAREIQMPEYDWENGDPDEFYETFVKHPHPVVLRGFMKNTNLTKNFTFQKLMERFGDEDVLLTKKELDGFPGKLRDVNDPNIYMHNNEVFFNKYPEFNEALNTERLEPYMHQKCGYSQLFVGRHGTGSPFHNAGVYNMFYMVDGTKRWYFIDPADTHLASPFWGIGRAAAMLMALYPDEYDEEAMPAFKYCPYYVADLEPGDVLFNPPWWWHAIRNTSEESVGIASRWHTDGIAGHKLTMTEEDYDIHRWASFNFFAGLGSIPFLHRILREPSPKFDEHATLREKNNRFAHHQRALAAGKMTAMGWRPMF